MASANGEFLAKWHRLVDERDLVALEAILAEDVSIGAPPYWDRLKGRPIVHHLLGLIIETIEELDQLLPKSLFRRAPLPWEAAFLAGRVFRSYRRRGGSRSRVLANVLIGAHAATEEMSLSTRDQGYTKYFQMAIENPAECPKDDKH